MLVVIAAPAALSATYAPHAAFAWRRRRARAAAAEATSATTGARSPATAHAEPRAPALSVIVPVCGPEEALADNVRALLAQRVANGHEVILCAERDDDAGLASLAPLLVEVAPAPVAPRIVIAGRDGDGPSK